MANKDLLGFAKEVAISEGISWRSLLRRAKQIVVYGSHATGATRGTSDLDLLCVGKGRRYKSKYLHIIWIPESKLESRRWRGSELATHLAAYGKWIKGENTWAKSSRPSRYAIGLITKRVLARTEALQDFWNALLPVYRTKQIDRLRRDVQRLVMMKHGKAPVAAGTLDWEWRRSRRKQGWKSLLADAPDLAQDVKSVLQLAHLRDSNT